MNLGLSLAMGARAGGPSLAAPSLAALSLGTVSTNGGQTVTVTGTNLTGATCTVDGSPVTVTPIGPTSFSFVAPAHAAGAVNVVATTAGGASNALSLTYATPFSMAAKTLTLWWRGGNYSDGGAGSANASWNGQASAGTSGTRNAGTILDPAAASLNSLAVPDFNGGVGAAGSALALAVALSNFVTASAWTMGILFYCDTATVDGATVDLNQLIFGDNAGALGLFVSSHSGGEVQLLQRSAGPTLNVARAPLVTGSWVYAHCSCSGGNISLDVNGTPVVTAAANIADLTTGLRIGRIGSLTSFDGKVAEIMVAASGAHWTRANAVSYLNDRYGLSLT